MTPANAKNMRFTLRYPPDKILKTFTGSFTATQSSTPGSLAFRTHSAFNHSLGGQAYLQMRYSRDGGTTWQDQHVIVPDLSVPTLPVFQTLEVGVYCTTTQIVMVASNWTGSGISVMYEVVAFAKPGVAYNTLPSSTGAGNFILSTRFNIQKIYDEDSTTVSIPSGGGLIQEVTIATHPLGGIPSARLFYTPVAGELWPFSPNQYTNIDGGPGTFLSIYGNPILTTSALKIQVVNSTGSSQDVVFDWRIYLDE